MDYKKYIRTFPDFPNAGKTFYDIAPLLNDGQAWHNAIDLLSDKILVFRPDVLVGIESRGFLLAAPLAHRLACGFIMVRKSGHLPGKTRSASYDMDGERGVVEVQTDGVKPGQRVVILDDILASGHTARATINLMREIGADVQGAGFLLELKHKKRCSLDLPYYTLMAF